MHEQCDHYLNYNFLGFKFILTIDECICHLKSSHGIYVPLTYMLLFQYIWTESAFSAMGYMLLSLCASIAIHISWIYLLSAMGYMLLLQYIWSEIRLFSAVGYTLQPQHIWSESVYFQLWFICFCFKIHISLICFSAMGYMLLSWSASIAIYINLNLS